MKQETKTEPNKETIWIVIPSYNEQKNITNVIKKIKKEGYKNILVVDDGSKDKTSINAKKEGALVLKHAINLGKGAAAKTGCDYAIKKGAKLLILMDGDGQHKPEDIPRFIKKLKQKKSDIVFGYRKIDENMPNLMKFGNWFISNSTKIIQGINIKDTQSGFRCFTAEAYKKIRWQSTDYSMESEMISNVAKNKLKYSEIEIQTIYHDKFKGTTIFDGIKIFINILKFKFLGG
mgnify:CR=1 FL=1